MMGTKKIHIRRSRRTQRTRHRIKVVSKRPRLAVFRSLNQIYGQIIDDVHGKTLVCCSSLELGDISGDKKQIAHVVGKELANRAKAQGIEAVVFDKGRYLYHGRVKALADGVREGGLKV